MHMRTHAHTQTHTHTLKSAYYNETLSKPKKKFPCQSRGAIKSMYLNALMRQAYSMIKKIFISLSLEDNLS